MGNDKTFTLYAAALFCGVVSLLAVMVGTDVAVIPTAQTFVVELALALGVRAAYKSLGGFDLSDWSVVGERSDAVAVPSADTTGIAHA